MLDCSTVRNVSVPTLDPKATAMNPSAHMHVLETAPSPRAEGSGTSTSFTQMHTSQLLMTMDVEALPRTPTTKDGLKTWAIATYQPLLQLDQPQKQFHQQVVRVLKCDCSGQIYF